MIDVSHNPELELAQKFLQYTDRNIFLTGKAGTGKTTFLQNLKANSPKRMVVVAPTGVAAINAGGVTIHSFFQMPFGPILPDYVNKDIEEASRFSSQKRNIIKSLDLLVIDEVSMVRADLLDGVDRVLRRFRRNSEPFGGVQLLLIGDMQQLPPVVKDAEWNMLRPYYDTQFFFSSLALKKTNYVTINLKHVYRQKDEKFIGLLNKIRDRKLDDEAINLLNSCYKPDFKGDDDNYIILTTHNNKARLINDEKLNELTSKKKKYRAIIEGKFPEYNFPTDEFLILKEGAQVMFVKNDPEPDKKFYNGKIGVVESLSDDELIVRCPGDDEPIFVNPLEWENVKYKINEANKEIQESVEGSFTQIPLRLAWSITIHKSQGLTFDKAIIDSEMAFAHGQVYVALSRCRTLEGMVLSSPVNKNSLVGQYVLDKFNHDAEEAKVSEDDLEKSKSNYVLKLLFDLFSFDLSRSNLQYMRKLAWENKPHILGQKIDFLDTAQDRLNKEIFDVSEKFKKQIAWLLSQNADIHKNDELQQRIIKAAPYFKVKIKEIILGAVEAFIIESDNKEIKKKLNKIKTTVEEEALFKINCLKSCEKGFFLKEYLSDRAKASMDEKPAKKRKPQKFEVPVDIINPELYNLIKSWRDEMAKDADIPHYMVLPLQAIRSLSAVVPETIHQFKYVNGFGKKKTEAFGEELLELIKSYTAEHKVEIVRPEVKKKAKKPKIPTRQISFDLWKKLKNIDKIAEERSLAPTTIMSHLTNYITSGEIEATEFIEKEKLNKISGLIKDTPDASLGELMEKTKAEFSYNELRIARCYLEFLEKA